MPEESATSSLESRYLDLLKKALTFALWPEPPLFLKDAEKKLSRPKRLVLKLVGHLYTKRGVTLALARNKKPPEDLRVEGGYWPAFAHTMVGLRRLDHLQSCIETVLKEDIPGDFIETGVWRGGSCIFMRGVLAALGVTDRSIFVADSFQGLPKPDPAYPVDASDQHHTHAYLAVSRAEVEENFRHYNLLDEQVVFLEGWFHETLPSAPIDQLAIARLDGDMYSSTIVALEHLYPKLSSGGFCIIDDYRLKGAYAAVMDYRKQQGITEEIIALGRVSAFWRKA